MKPHGNTTHGLYYHPLYYRFKNAKQRCTNKNNHRYNTYKGRWGKNTITELTRHYLAEYERFVKNNKNEVATIDRIDNDGKYEIGNIQIISRSENIKKRNREVAHPSKFRRKPVEGFIDGTWKKFISLMEAERQTGVAHQHIAGCCKGKRNTAGGVPWKYAK